MYKTKITCSTLLWSRNMFFGVKNTKQSLRNSTNPVGIVIETYRTGKNRIMGLKFASNNVIIPLISIEIKTTQVDKRRIEMMTI